jgi:hypothetical protein
MYNNQSSINVNSSTAKKMPLHQKMSIPLSNNQPGNINTKLSVVDSEIMRFNNNRNFEKFQENLLKKKATS